MNSFKGTNILNFIERFKSDEDCYQYLVDLKWDKGFKCSRCSGEKYYKGKKWHFRKCKDCNYDESCTAGTLFHKLKFPVLKAFHITFRLGQKKGVSSIQLSKDFDLQQKTCWLFRQKVQVAMASSNKSLLTGKVHVDEFNIGGPEKGKRGRSHSAKNKVIMAMEIRKKKKGKRIIKQMGRAYCQCIEDFTLKSFKPFFESKISPGASITTDGFKTYTALKKDFKKLKQEISVGGENFKEVHIMIMNFKGWLRGVHHKCSYDYEQKYLNEFIFKFNRRQWEGSIFDRLMGRIVSEEPWPYSRIFALNG